MKGFKKVAVFSMLLSTPLLSHADMMQTMMDYYNTMMGTYKPAPTSPTAPIPAPSGGPMSKPPANPVPTPSPIGSHSDTVNLSALVSVPGTYSFSSDGGSVTDIKVANCPCNVKGSLSLKSGPHTITLTGPTSKSASVTIDMGTSHTGTVPSVSF